MNTKNYLNQLKRIDTIPNLIKEIKTIFKSFEDNDYIPAIIEEGSFTVEQGKTCI